MTVSQVLPYIIPIRSMLVEFAAGTVKNVVLRQYLVDDIVKKYLTFWGEANFLVHKMKNVAFSHSFSLIIPIMSMLVEFPAGRAKNRVLRCYFVEDSVEKYLIFLLKTNFSSL